VAVREDCSPLLLSVGRQLCPELLAPHADLGVLRQKVVDEVSRRILEHYYDLQQ
jgi:hypothetical protein